ncbi:flagellar biosynthesis anti-sigma factor FlgM [Cobetia sp. ICG0124]|nr:flagellar biosynthesis anti-sigma factor FlgM [Cobetia sp. ICG0124]
MGARSSDRSASGRPLTSPPGDSTQVELSSSSIDAGQDIDQARVDSLKQAIADGSIKIDVDRIAQGLIDAFEGDA